MLDSVLNTPLPAVKRNNDEKLKSLEIFFGGFWLGHCLVDFLSFVFYFNYINFRGRITSKNQAFVTR